MEVGRGAVFSQEVAFSRGCSGDQRRQNRSVPLRAWPWIRPINQPEGARLCPGLPGPGMGPRVNPYGDRQRKGPEALGGVLVRGWNLDSLSYLKRQEYKKKRRTSRLRFKVL